MNAQAVRILHDSPEVAFLWRLAGWSGSGEMPGPPPGSDWEVVAALAQRAKATTVLANWARANEAKVPDGVGERLNNLAAVLSFRLSLMSERLAGVVRDLNATGVQPLLLKGAALHATHYRSPTDRPMNDVDLLVRRRDVATAIRIASRHGWAPPRSGGRTEFYWRHHHLAPMADTTGAGIPFELHTDLIPPGHPFAIATRDVLRDSGTVSVPGGTARVPSRNHLMIHNVIHWAWSHAMSFGTWTAVRDTAVLARDRALSWDMLVEELTDIRAASCAYWNLRMSKSLASAQIPTSVLQKLEPSLPGPLAAALERHFAIQAAFPTAGLPVWLMQGLWRLAVQPVWSGHRSVLPWQRDRVFSQAFVGAPPHGTMARRIRALGTTGRYLLGLYPANTSR